MEWKSPGLDNYPEIVYAIPQPAASQAAAPLPPFASAALWAAIGLHLVYVSGCVASASFAHAMVLTNTALFFFTAFYLSRLGLSRVLAQQGSAPLLLLPPTPTLFLGREHACVPGRRQWGGTASDCLLG